MQPGIGLENGNPNGKGPEPLYERQRKRLRAAREPFDEPPRELRPGPYLSVAERVRLARQRVRERNRRPAAAVKPEE
jgi:hypothetical protein